MMDFARFMEPIARGLLGDPNPKLSKPKQLRYGTNGSLAIDLIKGTWYDHEAQQGGGVLDLITRVTGLEGAERIRTAEELAGINGGGGLGPIVATYDYTDETGKLLFQVVRYEPKTFRQRKPDKEKPDGWSWSVKGLRQVPYRLPELIEQIALGHTVFIVEGEKDADNLVKLGVPATTNAGGVGKWCEALNEHFRGADVVIIPDNDPQAKHPKTGELLFHPDGRPRLPGQDHAQDVARALNGIAARVRVLDLKQFWPEMPLKGDVSIWITHRGTVDQLYAMVEQLKNWTEAQSDVPPLHWHGEEDPRKTRPFLIQDLLPEVGVGLLVGQWGVYKTFRAVDLVHCVISGQPFLSFEIVRPGGVLYIALEGASELPIRFQAVLEQKGDPDKYPKGAPFAWTDQCPPLINPDAATTIIAKAKEVTAVLERRFKLPLSMIMIDTIADAAGYRREGSDNDAAITQMVMNTLAQIARALGCFVCGIDHYGKDANAGTRGSSAKEARADVVLACLGDRSEAGHISNSRLALRKRRSGPNGEEFRFTARPVDMGADQNGRPITTLVLDWQTSDDDAPKPTKAEEWGGGKAIQKLRGIIMSLMADVGEQIRPFADGPVVRALKIKLVEAEFYKTYHTTGTTERNKRNAKRMAFQRAVLEADAKKIIITREIAGEDYVWLNKPGPGEAATSNNSRYNRQPVIE
jgi:hypothetical protein